MRNKVVLILVSLLISIAVFILSFFIIYNVACAISPPYIEEDNGEKHALMPIGQAMIGILLASVATIVTLIVCYKKLIKRTI